MLLAREELPVTLEPAIELFAFPALGQVFAKNRQCVPELGSSKQPGEVMASLVVVGTVDSPSQLLRQEAERKGIAGVHLHLKIRLLSVGSEGPLTDDEPHNVPDLELLHGGILTICSTVEQWHVAHCPRSPADEPRGTSVKEKSPPKAGSSGTNRRISRY